jgi:large subunit ribosomal protein L9
MKVIMVKDVGGLGRRDEVKDVSDGYAMNSLIPQGKAIQATPDRLAALTKKKAFEMESSESTGAKAAADAKKLHAALVHVLATANEQRHLYKQISRDEIAAAIKKEVGVVVDPHHIEPLEHIKTLGDFSVVVSLGGHKATITVQVEQA